MPVVHEFPKLMTVWTAWLSKHLCYAATTATTTESRRALLRYSERSMTTWGTPEVPCAKKTTEAFVAFHQNFRRTNFADHTTLASPLTITLTISGSHDHQMFGRRSGGHRGNRKSDVASGKYLQTWFCERNLNSAAERSPPFKTL